jgi:hypothetical protein
MTTITRTRILITITTAVAVTLAFLPSFSLAENTPTSSQPSTQPSSQPSTQPSSQPPTQPQSKYDYNQEREYNRYYEHYYKYMGEYMCPVLSSDVYKPKPAVTVLPLRKSNIIQDTYYDQSNLINHRHPAYIIAQAIDQAIAQAIEQSIIILIIYATTAIQYVSVIFSTTILLGILQFTIIAFLAYIMSIY